MSVVEAVAIEVKVVEVVVEVNVVVDVKLAGVVAAE